MHSRSLEASGITIAVAYLAAVAWMMANTSFDLWGAFVVAPPLGLLATWFIFRLFRGSQRPLAVVMSAGLVVKLGGVMARYWVGFEAYGGSIDAARYHEAAARMVGRIRGGDAGYGLLLPADGGGTLFLEKFTGMVYVVTGPSRLAGFLVFGLIGYLGVVLMVKAAVIAVPGLAARRYAVLCALSPSLVYWPSSIGKEAYMLASLGLVAFGVARVMSRRRLLPSLAVVGLGLAAASMVRPHLALLWLAGIVPALLVAFVRARGGRPGHVAVQRAVLAGVLLVAAAGTLFLSRYALEFLTFTEDTTPSGDTLSAILQETTRRTAQAGSNFEPPSVDRVQDWPYAIVRTLTRPLPFEARNLFQLLTSLEIAALLALCVLWWGRTKHLVWATLTVPFVAYAMSVLVVSGLVYSSFANLGVLARQKSLVMPFLLLIPCVPRRPMRQWTQRPALARTDAEPVRVGAGR